MDEVSALQRNITFLVFILAIFFAIIIFLYNKDLACGILLGAFFSVINFNLLALGLKRKVSRLLTEKKRYEYLDFLFFFLPRYLIMALVLWACIKKDVTLFIGTAIGLFGVRIAIPIEVYLNKKWKHRPHN